LFNVAGSLLLDLEAKELIDVAHRIVEDMVIHDQIPSDVKGNVMRTILTKHKYVTQFPPHCVKQKNALLSGFCTICDLSI